MERDHRLTTHLQKALASSAKSLGWTPADIEAKIERDSSNEEAVFVTIYLPSTKPFLNGPDYRVALSWACSVLAERQDNRPVYLRLTGEKEQAA